MINKDSVKVSSIDRIIGGVVAPDIVDVIMVRKPPRQGAVHRSRVLRRKRHDDLIPAGRGRFRLFGGAQPSEP